MRILPESDGPAVCHHPIRKGIDYSGAARFGNGEVMLHRVYRFGGEILLLYLCDPRSMSYHAGKRVELIADSARYHLAEVHDKWRGKKSG